MMLLKRLTPVCFLYLSFFGSVWLAGAIGDGAAMEKTVLKPEIDGEWWQIAGNPHLGNYTTEKQQPVDFGIWQAADGTWQLWSCIRFTNCGGHTRLFYRWEGKELRDANWEPMGIAMEADTSLGEQHGGLQAPHVINVDGTYYMFYGDFARICLATSDDGKTFRRVLSEHGQPNLFGGPWDNTRDPMTLRVGKAYYCYYTGHTAIQDRTAIGADFCRVSQDLRTWSHPYMVAFGGAAGRGPGSAECVHVVYREDAGLYYLFRTQRYGQDNVSTVYASPDPLNFGIDDDRYRVGTLPVAAPEIIVNHEGQDYIAALLPSLQGIRVAKLRWVDPKR
jgi:hypothetical protein